MPNDERVERLAKDLFDSFADVEERMWNWEKSGDKVKEPYRNYAKHILSERDKFCDEIEKRVEIIALHPDDEKQVRFAISQIQYHITNYRNGEPNA